VENKRILSLGFASLRSNRAVAVAAVVLPTPPLPPKKKYLDEERWAGSVGLVAWRVML